MEFNCSAYSAMTFAMYLIPLGSFSTPSSPATASEFLLYQERNLYPIQQYPHRHIQLGPSRALLR